MTVVVIWTNGEKGHLLWNAAQVISAYIEDHAGDLVRNKSVLELGAGGGLPSLVCALHDARFVLMTDYPEPDLIANLRYNIDHCEPLADKGGIVADGFLWGNSATPLLSHVKGPADGYDLLILADILFNHSEHSKLVTTLQEAMKPGSASVALVFFTPYRPWLLAKDLHFFELAKENEFVVTKILEHVMDKVMFDSDPGDELLRRTVFGYEVRRSV